MQPIDPRRSDRSRGQDEAPPDVVLSDDEIKMRAQSLRKTHGRTQAGVTGRAADAVTDTTRALVMRILWLARWPGFFIGGLVGFALFNAAAWTNFFGALALALLTAVLVPVVLTIIARRLEFAGIHDQYER